MGDFDIFNPKISRVIAGIESKTLLWHSAERKLGKTALMLLMDFLMLTLLVGEISNRLISS